MNLIVHCRGLPWFTASVQLLIPCLVTHWHHHSLYMHKRASRTGSEFNIGVLTAPVYPEPSIINGVDLRVWTEETEKQSVQHVAVYMGSSPESEMTTFFLGLPDPEPRPSTL